MSHYLKPIIISQIFLGIMCCTNSGAFPQDHSVEISYSLGSTEVSLREPITLTFSVQNNLGQAIKADLGWQGAQNFQFIVVRPDGSEIRLRPPLKEGFTPTGDIRVEPGKVYKKRLLLSEWFRFDISGIYQITASLVDPFKGEDGQIVAIDSGTRLLLHVGSRDEERIKKSCADLMGKISAAQSYDEAETAAKALAAFNDPIAVPYLKQATTLWHLEPITIAGLASIGNDRAVEVLISLFNSKDSEMKLLARAGLMRVQRQTSDQSLAEKIRLSLQLEDAKERHP